jgi:hypothetical protein
VSVLVVVLFSFYKLNVKEEEKTSQRDWMTKQSTERE